MESKVRWSWRGKWSGVWCVCWGECREGVWRRLGVCRGESGVGCGVCVGGEYSEGCVEGRECVEGTVEWVCVWRGIVELT